MSARLLLAVAVLWCVFGCANIGKSVPIAKGTPKVEPPPEQELSSLSCDPSFYEDLPTWASRSYSRSLATSPVRRRRDIVPDVLEGDFNGDGALDVAVAVASCEENTPGVVVLLRDVDEAEPYVFGAGDDIDLSWLSYWFVAHDPNVPDLLDLGERCTIGAEQPGAPLELDCSS